MKDTNLQSKILWVAMLCVSLAATGFASLELYDFSVVQFAALAIGLIVSLVINQHQFKIKNTKITLSAREFVIFLSVLWLSSIGAVLLAASAGLARVKVTEKSRKEWAYGIFTSVVSAFVATQIFYQFLYTFTKFDQTIVGANAVETPWLLAALGVTVIGYYLLSGIFTSIYQNLATGYAFEEIWKNNFMWAAANCVLGVILTLTAHFTFVEFGLSFGWVVLLGSIAAHLAYQIHVRRFTQKTKEISEASRIHLATVEALATAIDARDQVGVGHVRRTQIYAVGIGEILGLPEDELKALHTGALLHDIGKLAVPDHILNKPGKLTVAEIEKMKIHASVGSSILENVNFIYPVIPTVKYHHEKWDGSGYPEGLKRENIPLTARILSVADTYDSLRGARPYRQAISRDDARRHLLTNAGIQFDPKIVDVFLRNLQHFETEVEKYGFEYAFDAKVNGANDYFTDNNSDQSYVGQIKRANREVYTLYELARVFSSSLNLKDTLSLFAEKISELVPVDTCAVYLLNADKESANAKFVKGLYADELKNKCVKTGIGATGTVLETCQALNKIDPKLDFAFYQTEIGDQYKAMVSLPLIAEDGKLLGAVSLYSCELENYEEEHIRLLEAISRIASDAIAMSLQHAESESRALTDPMTGLPNARSLQMQFEKETARANRNGSNFQLLMLDLDGFKAVNDTYGHKVGDKMLKEISKVMRKELRDYDFLARYAGDEFVVIAPETNRAAIEELCGRMENAVLDFRLLTESGEYANVGVSLGAACYPQDGVSLDQIIIGADKAMYAVKAKRKREKLLEPLKSTEVEQAWKAKETESVKITEDFGHASAASPIEENNSGFVVELDESHIISTAIN